LKTIFSISAVNSALESTTARFWTALTPEMPSLAAAAAR
jgi:hypothetical protein